MSHIFQHSAVGFLIYYIIHSIWAKTLIIPGYLVMLIVFYSIFPDLDAIFWYLKNRKKKLNFMTLQHHYKSRMHYPLTYIPFIVLFLISLIFNFNPILFIIPPIGIYSHFLLDSISCGDGIMWGKNPLTKKKYSRFVNIYCTKTDGYHGMYWGARFRDTNTCKILNFAIMISAVILQLLQIISSLNSELQYGGGSYAGPLIYFLLGLYIGTKKYSEEWLQEPPEGRYYDYRIDPNYINRLSEKNRKKHFEKFSSLFENEISTLISDKKQF